jgi:hypothetical protein
LAFFGSFASIPLTNLLILMSGRNGLLSAEDYFKKYRLTLSGGRLVALEIDGRQHHPMAAELLLLNLLDARDGSFQFRAEAELEEIELTRFQALSQDAPQGGFPLASLSMALAKLQDDLENLEPTLPSADAVYLITRDPGTSLESPLSLFWEEGQTVLDWGVSPREVAVYTDYPLRSVRYCTQLLLQKGILFEKIRQNPDDEIQDLDGLIDANFLNFDESDDTI